MDFDEYQSCLVMDVEETARWRAQKAVEYPEDTRNIDSSRSLDTLAVRLKELPPDHPKLRELWRLQFGLERPGEASKDDLALSFIAAQSELLKRYGFDTPEEGEPEKFLTELIAAFQSEMA